MAVLANAKTSRIESSTPIRESKFRFKSIGGIPLDIRPYLADPVDMRSPSGRRADLGALDRVVAGPVTFLSQSLPGKCGFSHSAQRIIYQAHGVSRRWVYMRELA